ncbi:methyl-CpG-binding domain protein 1b isoform X2 [Salarias fasciatus]|uniref:Uncharacterized LOC115389137 n=1 Tax=Salarias fasciatus TaxID=181472 RepID=A0A672FP23_SALFA|nr:uncharacterized protein LOC115389137 isoform X2 [Salarias fasciatus]
MNEEPVESGLPGIEPVEEDAEQSSETDNTDPVAASDSLYTKEDPGSSGVVEDMAVDNGEPPMDWFEPVEDDEDDHSGRNDPEEESLAGESERSESVAGSEKTFQRFYTLHPPRRRRSRRDEGWVDWPALGEGWRRKEVVRRSGTSIGQKDVYYISPLGDRVRSRVELLSVVDGQLDMSHFDYKSGKFLDSDAPPIKVRNRRKKVRERSSSESSFMDREEAGTPDSFHRLTPNFLSKNVNSSPIHTRNSTSMISGQRARNSETDVLIKLPFPSSSKPLPLPSINGEFGSGDSTLICAKCGISFTGTWYDKQRKKPCCPTCWASKTKEHPMIRFRKWIPCGQCVACHNTINCGQCANCKHGLQSPENRRRICRKRKCVCPIRRNSAFNQPKSYVETPENYDDELSLQSEVADSQPSLKNSDTENVSFNLDNDDDDDMSTDDDDDWHKKRKRRSCGECKACLCRRDCGTCDFCVDKPKFGGSNKKRQKCRLRQCQRQAMRHLLPFEMGQGDFGPDSPVLPGRPRPHYTYSRKPGFKKNKGLTGFDSDNEDEDSNFQPANWSSDPLEANKHSIDLNPSYHTNLAVQNGVSDRVPHISNHNSKKELSRWDSDTSHADRNECKPIEDDEDELPMIANVFSFSDHPALSGADDVENQLMKLLHSLRSSVLPIMWHAILVEGPRLQLIQCSKQSNMTDTMVLIDPGFCYQVTVQKQPLLPTHPLYDGYPARLSSVTDVVKLLLGLENYVMCQGLPSRDSLQKDLVIIERASTCDFLVNKNVSVCSNCLELQEL